MKLTIPLSAAIVISGFTANLARADWFYPTLACGNVKIGTGIITDGYMFASPGDYIAGHDVRYEGESTINYSWSCSGATAYTPMIGFRSDTETVVLPITPNHNIQGVVTIRGRGAITLANITVPSFNGRYPSCQCRMGYEVASTNFSLRGLEDLKSESDQQGNLLQLKLKDYKLQKKMLSLMEESRERLQEIRANLNPNDPFDFVVQQKIDEILAGQDIGVTPEKLETLHNEVTDHLWKLGHYRDILVRAYSTAQGEMRTKMVEALRALNALINDANRQLNA